MKKTHIRALSDPELNKILGNHTAYLRGLLLCEKQRRVWAWVWRVWALGITGGVIWVLFSGELATGARTLGLW